MMKKEPTNETARFRKATELIETRSSPLKKELGLLNTSLMQILILLQITWIGQAAHAGSSHILFWLLAIILFFVPSAAVVTYLNRLMPLEGGLYQWAKLGFNDCVGFMVGWNYYMSGIVFIATVGIDVAVCLSYVAGSKSSWMSSDKWIITVANLIVIGALTIVALRGLGVGKRIYNLGGFIRLTLLVLLAALPFYGLLKGTLADYHPLRIALPQMTTPTFLLANLSILGKIAFGAFGGFDEVPILAGECRNPTKTITRSVIIAAPIIATVYIFSTSAVEALVPSNETVDLVGTVQQVLMYGLGPAGRTWLIVSIASLALMFVVIATISVVFVQNVRLPMTAGWDYLLPQWFTRLHAEYKTPVNSTISRVR
jgi:amino acid transporter